MKMFTGVVDPLCEDLLIELRDRGVTQWQRIKIFFRGAPANEL